MPNRDYAVRSKNQRRGGSKLAILVIVLLLLAVAGLGLWALQATAPVQTAPTPVKSAQPKNTLPTPPEEVYSYIRDLENREVPIDKNSKVARLTKEQEQLLQQQKEEEKRKQAQFEQQQQAATQPVVQASSEIKPIETKPSQDDVIAQKNAEEKRKAELKKQQEQAKEQAKKEPEQKPLEAKKAEEKSAQTAPKEQAKPKPAEAPKVVGKFGLQCGAFKNKAQAENMQARLAMAGFNARINSSGEWNRVVVGPVGDRAAASQALANSRSVAECVIVGM